MLVAGGSPGLTGAPCLAALAAARAGAGYVTVCVPASLSLVFESRLLEQMTIALPDADGGLKPEAIEPLAAAAAAATRALSCSGRGSGEPSTRRRSCAGCSTLSRCRSCSTPTA